MPDDIKALLQEIADFSVTNASELENFRLEFISKNGKVQSMFKRMGSIPKEEKAAFGKSMNDLKNAAQSRFEELKAQFDTGSTNNKTALDDITLSAPTLPVGSLHPLTQTLEEMKRSL